jgi:cytochrome c oxidase assembly factor CtaG
VIAGLPFRWHLPEVVAILALAIGVVRLHLPASPRRRALVAVVTLFVVLVWPFGDLASEVSLTAAVVQRLVIMLVVVPLLLGALPVATLDRLTRPRLIDTPVRVLSHPGLAMVFVTVIGSVTVSPIVVDWGARSEFGHLCSLAMTVLAGVVLWIPGLGVVPGTRHLSPTGRAGYVFISSVVVTVLSFVWIFLRHPIYPGLAHQEQVLHISALLDQQLAGFAAKLGAYGPMWIVAYLIFFRAEEEGRPVEDSPLHWADVERHLLRVDRARARANRRRRPAS